MSECESARNAAVSDLHAATGLGSLSPHFMECADCRRFVVRTRRMTTVVRNDEPTAAEILRLRVRLGPGIPGFGSSRAPAPRKVRPRHALVLAFALLTGTVAAASSSAERLLQVVGLQRAEPAPSPALTRKPVTAPPRRRVATQEGAPQASTPTPEVLPPVEPLGEPRVEALQRAPASAQRQREPAPKAKPEAKWADVAASLRASDHDGAQRALSELSHSSDAVTRDTARLSLAQLWLKQGRTGVAQELLRELSRSGATPFIRRRAGELLR